jgi:hypothetical protein
MDAPDPDQTVVSGLPRGLLGLRGAFEFPMLILEQAVEFIADDELMEIAPRSIRLRKRLLKEHGRRRTSREGG